MESVSNHPGFDLLEGEVVQYTHPNTQMTIKSDKDEIVLVYGTLTLTTARVLYIQILPRKICITFRYQNCITHGIDKQNLVCNISDLQEHIEEEDDEENEIEQEPDFLMEKIKNIDSDAPEDWIQLVGNYQILFHFGESGGQEHLKTVFNLFSECSALNPDEDADPEQNNFMDNEFITANDIDEDGNVRIPGNSNEEEFVTEQGGYEDDDEGIKDILESGQMGSKKTKGENTNMEME